MQIKYIERPISAHIAELTLAQEGMSELFDNGWGYRGLTINWDDQAIVAYVRDEPVGIILFSESKFTGAININHGYVAPPYRHEGIYKALWDKLVKVTKEKGFRYIDSGHNIANTRMESIFKARGARPISIAYEYEVEYDED